MNRVREFVRFWTNEFRLERYCRKMTHQPAADLIVSLSMWAWAMRRLVCRIIKHDVEFGGFCKRCGYDWPHVI